MQPFNLTVYVPSIWVSPSNDTAICSAPSELVLSITEQLAVLFSSAYPSLEWRLSVDTKQWSPVAIPSRKSSALIV